MIIVRSEEWWRCKAEAEEGVVGAGAMPDSITEDRTKLIRQLADEIEQLRIENARLKAALMDLSNLEL
jgi:hypothetical protein